MTPRQILTTKVGPVVVSARTYAALAAIRREKLLPLLHGNLVISRRNAEAAGGEMPAWLSVRDDEPSQQLPSRVAAATELEAATLKLALACGASLILIDGPIKEAAKLSFMKCEGAVSILVAAHREGHLSAVPPMIKALQALGYADVLPPPEALDALYEALKHLQ